MHVLIAALIVTFFIGLNAYLFSDYLRSETLLIQTKRGDVYGLKIEIAKTFREKQSGLMHRRRLEVGKGMLFVYDHSLIPAFWMKNMNFPLDMIFIGEDLLIRDIAEKVPPCKNEPCPTYTPSQPAQYVLEVPGGYTQLFKIKTGDKIELPESITGVSSS